MSAIDPSTAPAVLVTGGAGYIGSHVCRELAAAGFRPVTYDNLVYGHRWAVQWGPLEVGDILDRARLGEVMEAYKPVAVIHLAAFAYVGESVTDPAKYYRNNVVGTLSLLDEMRARDVHHIVFSSTCAVYGDPGEATISEELDKRPVNPYGASKSMIERIMADYSHAYRLSYVLLRYFNASGADPSGAIGEAHSPETHLIPLVLDVALGRLPKISVFGTDYPTPDGTCVRDYIHVNDLAVAHVKSLQRLLRGGHSDVFNLGTGRGYSVREVIDLAARVTGRPIASVDHPRRPGDPPSLVAANQKALAELAWQPQYASLEQILAHAWAFHQKHWG